MKSSKRGHRRWFVAIAASAILCPMFAGVGLASSSAASQPIKLGMISDVNNPYINFDHTVTAARAGILGINKSGGIDGRQVQLVFCNENVNASTAASCARQLASAGVVATVGDFSAAGAGGEIASILATHGIQQIGPIAITAPEYTASNNWVVATGPAWDYPACALFGAERGLTKVVPVVSVAGEFPQAISYMTSILKAKGGTLLPEIVVPTSATDYAPYAEAIVASGAQAVAPITASAQYVALMQAVRAIGSNVVFESNSGTPDPSDLTTLGSAADGSLICYPFPPVSATKFYPELRTLKKEMAEENATGDEDVTYNDLLGVDELSWWDTQAFATLAKTIKGNITAKSVATALRTDHNLQTGLIPNWTPTTKGPSGFTKVSWFNEYTTVVQNGVITLSSTTPVNMKPYVGS
jgi:ABC-type branched-subunit amino acid transport system substrate-binding protein